MVIGMARAGKCCAFCVGFWLLGVAVVVGVLIYGPDLDQRMWS